MENNMEFLRKLIKIELPNDTAIMLLGRYSEELKTVIQERYFTPMLITTLFTIAKIGSNSNVH
jgi:hypothetical protein